MRNHEVIKQKVHIDHYREVRHGTFDDEGRI